MTAIKFNINNYVRVKLTPLGREIHRKQHEDLNNQFPAARLTYRAPEEDADGWSKWQAWELMRTFGNDVWNGCKVPFETTIEILTDDTP